MNSARTLPITHPKPPFAHCLHKEKTFSGTFGTNINFHLKFTGMKNACVFFLLLLLPFTGKAGSYKDISSLKTGDWIRFEMVRYYPEKCLNIQEKVPWRTENIRKLRMKATVLKKTKHEITLGYQLEYLTDCINNPDNSQIFYYDSRYIDDLQYTPITNGKNQKKEEDLFDQSLNGYFIQATYDIESGKIISSDSISENLRFQYLLRQLSKGIALKKMYYLMGPRAETWDLKILPFSTVPRFISQWYANGTTQSGMPMKTNDPVTSYYEPETHIVDASFPLPHNVSLTYIYTDEKAKQQQSKTLTFFSAYPQKYKFAYHEWLIMPGDSIVLTQNEKREYTYSGVGAAPNNFQKERRRIERDLDPLNFSYSFSSYIKIYLEKWNKAYNELYARYAPELDPFWKSSFQLTQSYYTNNILLRDYLLNYAGTPEVFSIDWNAESFTRLSPFTDYALLPEFYGNFLTNYAQYKSYELYNDNLTTLKRSWRYIDLYHFQRQILSGYPKYKANADLLKKSMQYYNLQNFKREYDEFIAECPDSTLIKEVKHEHERFMKIEPGEYIQHTGLDLAKEIPIRKTKEKSYTLLNLSLTPITEYRRKNIEQKDTLIAEIRNTLEKNNLSGHVTLRFCLPEPPETIQPTEEEKRKFTFIAQEQLVKYLGQVPAGNTQFTILVRNDGKIIHRLLDPFSIPIHEIVELIQEDLNTQESATAGSSFWLRFLLSALIGGLTVFIWGRIKQKKEKSKRLLAQLEMKALRSQMNPHFIFNALNSIQNLINRSETEQANRYLLNFAKLLRLVLSSSEKKLVPLTEEIEQLRLYIDLEQLRLPFEANIQISDTVNPEITEIPGMLIQPLVENAIKHGIAPRGGGKIEIRFERTETFLKITVTDDGPGIRTENTTEGSGFGLKSVRERLKLLQGEYHASISLQTENNINQPGCRITLSIPVE